MSEETKNIQVDEQEQSEELESDSLQKLRNQILAQKALQERLMTRQASQEGRNSSLYDELVKKANALQFDLDENQNEDEGENETEENVDALKARITELEGIVEELENSNNEPVIDPELEEARTNIHLLQGQIETLEKTIKALEEQNAVLEEKAKEFSEEKIEGLKQRQQKEIEELKAHYEELLAKAGQATDSESLNLFIKNLEQENAIELEKERRNGNKTVNSLKRQVERLKEELSKLKKELARAQRALNSKSNSQNKQIEQLQKKLALATKELSLVKANLAHTRASVLKDITSKEIEILREELEDEKRNLEVMKEQYEVDSAYLEIYKEAIEQKYLAQIAELKKTIEELNGKTTEVVVESGEVESLKEELLLKVKDLKNEAAKNVLLEAKVLELVREIDDLKEEIKTLKAATTFQEESGEKDIIIEELNAEILRLKNEAQSAVEEEKNKVAEISAKFQDLLAFLEQNKDVINEGAVATTLREELDKEIEVEKELYKIIEEKDAEIRRLKENPVKSEQAFPFPLFYGFYPQNFNNPYLEELAKKDQMIAELQKKYDEDVLALNKRIEELEELVKGFKEVPAVEEENSVTVQSAPLVEENEVVLEESNYTFNNETLNKLNNITRTKNALIARLKELETNHDEELNHNLVMQADCLRNLDDLHSRLNNLVASYDESAHHPDDEKIKFNNEKAKILALISLREEQLARLSGESVAKIDERYNAYVNDVQNELNSLSLEEEKIKSSLRNPSPKPTRVIDEYQRRRAEKLAEESVNEEPEQEEAVQEESNITLLDASALEAELDEGFGGDDNLSAMYSKHKREANEMIETNVNVRNYIKVTNNIETYTAKLNELNEKLAQNPNDASNLLNEASAINTKLEVNKKALVELKENSDVIKYIDLENRINDIGHMLGK